MKGSSTSIANAITLGASVALAAAACGSDEPSEGDAGALLTIAGDFSLQLEGGESAELEVRYHDRDDEPLHGTVEFEIDGDARGAQLGDDAVTTDDDGVAAVTLEATNEDAASFEVRASAPDAASAVWDVALAEPVVPLDPSGAYRVESTFDMIAGLEEGTFRDVVHALRDFSDDPGTFLLRLAIEEGCGSTCTDLIGDSTIDAAGLALTIYLEDEFPALMADLVELGDDVFDLAENTVVVSDLEVSGEEGARTAEHAPTDFALNHAGEQHLFAMEELAGEAPAPASAGFEVGDRDREIQVHDHALSLPYGTYLEDAIEEVLIPSLEGSPDGLADLLHSRIDCGAVGAFLDEEISILPITDPVLGTVLYDGEDLCELGIDEGSAALMSEIGGLDDSSFELAIAGDAQVRREDDGARAEGFASGAWMGQLDYGGELASTLDSGDGGFDAERVD